MTLKVQIVAAFRGLERPGVPQGVEELSQTHECLQLLLCHVVLGVFCEIEVDVQRSLVADDVLFSDS